MTQTKLHLTTVLAVLHTGLITGCSAIGSTTPDTSTNTRIRITSEPPGATLYLMGAQAGITPVMINDRDIYPVSYTPETEKYYGKIILRKEGCEEFTKRLTRSEVRGGLVARLDCGANATNEPAPKPPSDAQPAVVPVQVPVQKPTLDASRSSRRLPEQKLEQLKTLQRLQEEGVLTEDEEKKLRKRILDNP